MLRQQSVSYSTSDAHYGGSHLSPQARVARPSMLIVLGALTGLLLGALTRWVDNLPDGWRSVALIGAPWLGLAFALGALTVLWGGRRVAAAIGGAVATVGAVLGYYGYMHVVEHEANAYYLAHYLTFWLVPALLGGPLFGAAGAAWRDGSARLKALAVGLLGAVCVGEGGLDTLASLGAQRSADAVSVAELALGLVLPLVLLRARTRRLIAYGTIAGCGLVGVVGLRLIASLLTMLNRP